MMQTPPPLRDRVLQGGSFNVTPDWLRSAFRFRVRPTVGVRLVARAAPAPPTFPDRELRGGSFGNTPYGVCSAHRLRNWPARRNKCFGVRLVVRRET